MREQVEKEQGRNSSSVNEYYIVSFHSIQEWEVLFLIIQECTDFLVINDLVLKPEIPH